MIRLVDNLYHTIIIPILGALLAIEQEDESALKLVLTKHPLEVNAYLNSGKLFI